MCDSCKKQRTCWDKNYCEKYERNREQTNEEWFCGLSTEQKAEVFLKFQNRGINARSEVSLVQLPTKYDVVNWLKQPHTDKEQ